MVDDLTCYLPLLTYTRVLQKTYSFQQDLDVELSGRFLLIIVDINQAFQLWKIHHTKYDCPTMVIQWSRVRVHITVWIDLISPLQPGIQNGRHEKSVCINLEKLIIGNIISKKWNAGGKHCTNILIDQYPGWNGLVWYLLLFLWLIH